MTTKTKVNQLEEQFNRKTRGGRREELVRHVSYNTGQLIDGEGYLLSDEKVKKIEKESKEVASRGGLIINLTRYGEPKVREKKLTPIEGVRTS